MEQLNITKEPMEWRRFTPIGSPEEMAELEKVLANKDISRDDLATILLCLQPNPHYVDILRQELRERL